MTVSVGLEDVRLSLAFPGLVLRVCVCACLFFQLRSGFPLVRETLADAVFHLQSMYFKRWVVKCIFLSLWVDCSIYSMIAQQFSCLYFVWMLHFLVLYLDSSLHSKSSDRFSILELLLLRLDLLLRIDFLILFQLQALRGRWQKRMFPSLFKGTLSWAATRESFPISDQSSTRWPLLPCPLTVVSICTF